MPRQVLISWALHRDTFVIPTSVTPSQIDGNLASERLSLTDDDMAVIAKLDRGRRHVRGDERVVEGSPYTLEGIWNQ